MNFIQLVFLLHHVWHGKQILKRFKKLCLLTDTDMLLMVQKGIKGGICHSIYRYGS